MPPPLPPGRQYSIPAATGNDIAIALNAVEGEGQSTQDTGERKTSYDHLSPVEEAEFRGFAPSVPTLRGQTSTSQFLSGTG
ncbi:hypothetical protein PR048_027907 [Dryococelus australis]|uniref:Uncharacterized protein n=1 Tax=Dryococelus australis TaxID=614101 RepID=A0ABQ9GHR7_9NEOP|nr:hypothetical protein PR048_027907 [Dryococelus australis]